MNQANKGDIICMHVGGREHGFDDYDVAGIPKVTRATVGLNIKKGETFNIYCEDGVKLGGVWKGSLEASLAHFVETSADLRALQQDEGTVPVVVLARNASGEPEFHTCTMTVSSRQRDDGKHYDDAIESAQNQGFEGECLAFDATDAAGRQLESVLAFLRGNPALAASSVPDDAPLMLNPCQVGILDLYRGGEFKHLAQSKTVAEFRLALAQCGDGILRYLMVELSDNEDCYSLGEALSRVSSSIGSMQQVMTILLSCPVVRQADDRTAPSAG
ncbi:hypothetical protein [Burkholderia sp. Ac-20365]|uniref:hypothetical protein n=1 Tax=Burkholderia sp. Ac-20365 TaxID=2703897 RepID=UPI00197BE130|nr:hypothetical protein [Burkholderia sp. Ac-20365]MBN3760875.1 hypothetical protein [Burkholderia sp. Ac-20365]